MATKETMIVFVYDSECLKDEADDPVKAVLYFHPSWVSDTQKVALCGQLMASSYFLKDCFFKPRILALQNGKFILKEFGRFVLTVGTDRNVSDYLLQYRADLLTSLVRLFHRDLKTIYDKFPLSGQDKNLSQKLYLIFETYLPVLQHKGNIFRNVTKLRMTKPASIIFLDAIETLECCQQTTGVLGGVILYHNKIIATQLNDQVSKQLVLTDPLHVRTTAEQLNMVDFHIPNGVQMIAIYIDQAHYQQLVVGAQRIQNVQTVISQNTATNMTFTFAKRKIKRDQSLIFTNIPEEWPTSVVTTDVDEDDKAALIAAAEALSCVHVNKTQKYLPPQPRAHIRPKSLLHPTRLPLCFIATREIPESGISSLNFDESDSFPEFIGRTSICATPLTENKILPVYSTLSICGKLEANNHIMHLTNQFTSFNPFSQNANNLSDSKQTVKTPSSSDNHRRNLFKINMEKFFQNFITSPYKLERRKSFTDFQDSLKKLSNKIAIKEKNPLFGEETDEDRNGHIIAATPMDFIDHDKGDNERNDRLNNCTDQYKRTITDPTNPVFTTHGDYISGSLFQEFLERYYTLCDNNTSKEKAEVEEFKEFDNDFKKFYYISNTNTKTESVSPMSAGPKIHRNWNTEKAKTPSDRKSLSLPLKPLTDVTPSQVVGNSLPFGNSRKQPGGIPLTPLMAKLSVLSLNEESTGCSFMSSHWSDMTSGSAAPVHPPLGTGKLFRRRGNSSTKNAKWDYASDMIPIEPDGGDDSTRSGDEMQRVELYMCGQQNMTLLLLMEQGLCCKQSIVKSMFDICVAKFPQMESNLTEILNINVESDQSENDYSFMCIDSKWDTLQRSGAWNPVEVNTLETVHRDMKMNEDITDLILRSNDCVFYGYQTGRTEVFYKEASHQTTGIPLPSDPMSNIAMRARMRLERDHSLVLL